jgi:RNA polymerase-binding transcription factor DksA
MATPKKAATAKKTTPAAKAVKPTAKPVAKKAVPAKKVESKPAAKKAVAVAVKKAAVPAKKAASVPAKAVAVAKKAAPAKNSVAAKAVKAKAPVKKAAPVVVKKAPAVAAKKTATPAPVAKKAKVPEKAPAKSAPAKSVPAKPAPAKPVVEKVIEKTKAVAKAAKPAKPVKKVVIKAPMKGPLRSKTPARDPEPEQRVAPPPFKKAAPPPPPRPTKVVVPEIKTKTIKKYEPDFTKSVLDASPITQSGPTMRYSDAELVEFRELIQKKLEAAKKELSYLQGLITRKDEMGGDESESRYMTMEDGSVSMEREQLAQMASRQITFIDHLEKAMMRIESKTYGICRVTGKLIDKARLRAVPHATLSIEAKQMMNK